MEITRTEQPGDRKLDIHAPALFSPKYLTPEVSTPPPTLSALLSPPCSPYATHIFFPRLRIRAVDRRIAAPSAPAITLPVIVRVVRMEARLLTASRSTLASPLHAVVPIRLPVLPPHCLMCLSSFRLSSQGIVLDQRRQIDLPCGRARGETSSVEMQGGKSWSRKGRRACLPTLLQVCCPSSPCLLSFFLYVSVLAFSSSQLLCFG